jgi:hypothetical protein
MGRSRLEVPIGAAMLSPIENADRNAAGLLRERTAVTLEMLVFR